MFDITPILAEKKMQEAVAKGLLRNLAGEGKPLDLEDPNPYVSQEERLFMKFMKDFGVIPPEVLVLKEIENLREQLKSCEDAEQRERLKKELNEYKLQQSLMMEARTRRRG